MHYINYVDYYGALLLKHHVSYNQDQFSGQLSPLQKKLFAMAIKRNQLQPRSWMPSSTFFFSNVLGNMSYGLGLEIEHEYYEQEKMQL